MDVSTEPRERDEFKAGWKVLRSIVDNTSEFDSLVSPFNVVLSCTCMYCSTICTHTYTPVVHICTYVRTVRTDMVQICIQGAGCTYVQYVQPAPCRGPVKDTSVYRARTVYAQLGSNCRVGLGHPSAAMPSMLLQETATSSLVQCDIFMLEAVTSKAFFGCTSRTV